MKKSIAVLAVLVFAATGAFAQMSVGGGLLVNPSFNNGFKAEMPGSGSGGMDWTNTTIGAFVFFDAAYAELGVNFGYGITKAKGTGFMNWTGSPYYLGTYNGGATQFGLSLLGKYPINLGAVTVFPLLGVEYNVVLSWRDENDQELGGVSRAIDLSQLGFLAGVGMDYGLSDRLYLRGEAMFQLRLPSKFAKDMADLFPSGTPGYGMGPVIKIGVGYKF